MLPETTYLQLETIDVDVLHEGAANGVAMWAELHMHEGTRLAAGYTWRGAAAAGSATAAKASSGQGAAKASSGQGAAKASSGQGAGQRCKEMQAADAWSEPGAGEGVHGSRLPKEQVEAGRQQVEAGGQQVEAGGQQVEAGGQQVEAGGQQVEAGGHQGACGAALLCSSFRQALCYLQEVPVRSGERLQVGGRGLLVAAETAIDCT